MDKKLIPGSVSILIGVMILSKGVGALYLLMTSFRSGRFELSSFITAIIFIAVILLASFMILKGNEHLKK